MNTNEKEQPGAVEDNPTDYEGLKRAARLLESPSLTAKLTDLLGSPVEWLVKKLPAGAQDKVHEVVVAGLHKAVSAALFTMNADAKQEAFPKLHTIAAAASGAAGGFFGFAGLAIEVPFTTTIIMRSIADIARSEGFQVDELHVQMECVSVFGLGGTQAESADAGYFAARAAFQRFAGMVAVEVGKAAGKQAGKAGARKLTEGEAAKWLAQLIAKVAARFEIVITEKAAAQAAPVIGAAFGATLNALIINFYQDMARGHFIVNRLANKYGEAAIEQAYMNICKRKPGK